MKKMVSIIAFTGAVMLVALVVRYSFLNTARSNAELYQWKLEWASRK